MNPTTLGSATPPAPPEQIAALTELAMDLRWSWNHSMDELWRRLDPALWALTNHPSVVLQTVTRERLATALADAEFCQLPDRMLEAKRHAETAPRWFQERYPQVSRQIFAPLFPRWPVDEVPISYVTNGVHMPTWDSAAADRLWTEASGKERWQGTSATLEADLRSMPDEKLWAMRTANRKALVDYARETIGRQMTVVAAEPEAIVRAQARLDPSILTLGFARRFATYKRPNLLLHDPARLLRILNHPERPAQLILAGKAHPADGAGQALIQQWMQFIRQNEANARVVFLADYDMLLAERLVQGVDVWINTPRRPWEACGTSGMKVLVNGGINISELDGWWAEAYAPEVGWAMGDGLEHGDDPAWDAAEAEVLYELLEQSVIPEFFSRNEDGIPTAWVARMRESMAGLTPRFSASRTVREYTEQHYLPAASAYRARAADKGAAACRLVDWQNAAAPRWAELRFGAVTVETKGHQHFIAVEVFLRDASPETIRVELYADGVKGGSAVKYEMTRARQLADRAGGYSYRASVPSARPATDYTARIMAHCDGIATHLEAGWILWQK